MKTKMKIGFLIACFCMILSMTSIVNVFAEGSNISMTVSKTEVAVGDTFTVVISNADLNAAGFGVVMDYSEQKDLIECTNVTGVDDDEYLGMYYSGKKGAETWIDANVGNDAANTNSDGIFSFGVVTGKATDFFAGTVATLTFTAKAEGTVTFTLTERTSGTDAFDGVAQTATLTIKPAAPAVQPTEINNLIAAVPVPEDGDSVGSTTVTTTGTGYKVSIVDWLHTDTYASLGAPMGSEDTFEAGETYVVEVKFTPENGYKITDYPNHTVKINDDTNANFGGWNTGTGAYTYRTMITIPATEYDIAVTGGTASANKAVAGTVITLTVDESAIPAGKVFDKWEVVSGGVTVTDGKFTMPESAVEINATYKDAPVVTEAPVISYEVTDDAVIITATGKGEVKLYADGDEPVNNPYIIPRGETEITVTFTATAKEEGKEISETVTKSVTVPAVQPTEYDITVTGGTASANKAVAGTEITLTVDESAIPAGKVFDKWEVVSGGVTITDGKFTMPESAVEITATYKDAPVSHTCGGKEVTLVPEIPATCTVDGQKAYYICSCGKNYADKDATTEVTDLADLVIKAGHKITVQAGYEATCLEDGLTEGRYCSVCKEVFAVQEVIPATGHDWTAWVTVKVEGETRYQERYCACGAKQESIIDNGHDYTVQLQDADHIKTTATKCTEFNTYWYACSVCGANAKNDPNATDKFWTGTIAGDHSFTEKIADAAHLVAGTGANCQDVKEYYYDCAYCDEIGTTTWASTEMGDHEFDTTQWGYKDVATGHAHKCKFCDEHDAVQPHTPNMANPTETEDKICTACQIVLEPAYGHICKSHLTKVPANGASCTVDGNIEYYECSCGKWFSDATATVEITDKDSVVIKGGHKYGELVQEEPAVHTATEQKDGMKAHYFCDECDTYFTVEKVATTKDALVIANAHSYGTEWKSDKDNHWNECACGDKANSEAHKDDNSDGKCDVCEYNVGLPTTPDDDKPNDNPQTGDNSNMFLWIALLFISGAGVVATTVFGKKRFSVK